VLGKIHREDWPSPRAKLNTGFWSAEATETAKRMWLGGDSAGIIAEAFGTTGVTVGRLASRQRWPARQMKRTLRHDKYSHWTPEIIETAKRMWVAGDSIKAIAPLGSPIRQRGPKLTAIDGRADGETNTTARATWPRRPEGGLTDPLE
jgi:hypothetical protein